MCYAVYLNELMFKLFSWLYLKRLTLVYIPNYCINFVNLVCIPIFVTECSYLTNLKFYVTVNSATSTLHNVISGIPQVLSLGPLLFISYTESLKKVAKFCTFFLYADDSKKVKIVFSPQHCFEL